MKRTLSEPKQAPAGCYEVTSLFGFTQEERRAGGEVSAARLRHPGQDPPQGFRGDRETAKARSIFVLDSGSLKCPCLDLASVSPTGRWAGRLTLEMAGHYNLVDVSLFMPLR